MALPLRVADQIQRRLVPWAASCLIRVLGRLARVTLVGQDIVLDLHRRGQPYVHAFFHDQLLMMTYSYLGQSFGRRLAVLSSRHRDGEYVSRTLERFGHLMVRGSTSHGGVGGLKEMIRHLRAGDDAAFATDGPRGPRHHVQIGVIEAARLGRAPVVPVAFAASKKKLYAPGIDSRFRSPLVAWFSPTVSRSTFRAGRIGAAWS